MIPLIHSSLRTARRHKSTISSLWRYRRFLQSFSSQGTTIQPSYLITTTSASRFSTTNPLTSLYTIPKRTLLTSNPLPPNLATTSSITSLFTIKPHHTSPLLPKPTSKPTSYSLTSLPSDFPPPPVLRYPAVSTKSFGLTLLIYCASVGLLSLDILTQLDEHARKQRQLPGIEGWDTLEEDFKAITVGNDVNQFLAKNASESDNSTDEHDDLLDTLLIDYNKESYFQKLFHAFKKCFIDIPSQTLSTLLRYASLSARAIALVLQFTPPMSILAVLMVSEYLYYLTLWNFLYRYNLRHRDTRNTLYDDRLIIRSPTLNTTTPTTYGNNTLTYNEDAIDLSLPAPPTPSPAPLDPNHPIIFNPKAVSTEIDDNTSKLMFGDLDRPQIFQQLYDYWWLYMRYSLQQSAAFIKLGQYLSTRPDIFSPEVCSVLAKLQDDNEFHPWMSTVELLDQAFGENWSEFLYLEEQSEPLASGCIAQVYRCQLNVNKYNEVMHRDGVRAKYEEQRLKQNNNTNSNDVNNKLVLLENLTNNPLLTGHNYDDNITVAIKVLHPDVWCISRDLHLLSFLVHFAECLPYAALQFASPVQLSNEFSRLMYTQLNLNQEHLNLKRFHLSFLQDYGNNKTISPSFPIPLISTNSILIETYHSGVPMSLFLSKEKLDQKIEKIAKLSRKDMTILKKDPNIPQRRKPIDQYGLYHKYKDYFDYSSFEKDVNYSKSSQKSDQLLIDTQYPQNLPQIPQKSYNMLSLPPELHDLRTLQQEMILQSTSPYQYQWLRHSYAESGLDTFLTMCFELGFFHADLHCGNLVIDLGFNVIPPHILEIILLNNKIQGFKHLHYLTLEQEKECVDMVNTYTQKLSGFVKDYNKQLILHNSNSQLIDLDMVMSNPHDLEKSGKGPTLSQLYQQNNHNIIKTVNDYISKTSLMHLMANLMKKTINEPLDGPPCPIIDALGSNAVRNIVNIPQFLRNFSNALAMSQLKETDNEQKNVFPQIDQTSTSSSSTTTIPVSHDINTLSQYYSNQMFDPDLINPSEIFNVIHGVSPYLHNIYDNSPELHYKSHFYQHRVPQPTHKPRLIMLDAGMSTSLTKRDKDNFNDLFLAISLGDGYRAASMMIERAQPLFLHNIRGKRSSESAKKEKMDKFYHQISVEQLKSLGILAKKQENELVALSERYNQSNILQKGIIKTQYVVNQIKYDILEWYNNYIDRLVNKSSEENLIIEKGKNTSYLTTLKTYILESPYELVANNNMNFLTLFEQHCQQFAHDDARHSFIKQHDDTGKQHLSEIIETLHIKDDIFVNLRSIPYNPLQTKSDRENFVRAIGDLILDVKKHNFKLDSLGVVQILTSLITYARQYHVKLDTSFISVVIAVIIFEGVGRQLDPMMDIITPAISIIVKSQLKELSDVAHGKMNKAQDKVTEVIQTTDVLLNDFEAQYKTIAQSVTPPDALLAAPALFVASEIKSLNNQLQNY